LHAQAIFDLASLTKVLVTTTLVAQCHARQELALEDPLPGWDDDSAPRVDAVLEHAAGFFAHRNYFADFAWPSASAREEIVRRVRQSGRSDATPAPTIYSDLGFIALCAALEEVHGKRLDLLFQERIVRPLGLDLDDRSALTFAPLDRPEDEVWPDLLRVVPSEVYDASLHPDPELVPWLSMRRSMSGPEQWAHGQVHDDNAYCMLGVSGHAGLFGTVQGVYELALAWLEPARLGISAALRDRFWHQTNRANSTRCLGWDGIDPTGQGSTGSSLQPNAVGHLGFTGTSLWIEPRNGDDARIFILLSHRVHPRRDPPDAIRKLRQDFHALASELFEPG
jgi:CubicO group peptidase (beta-lactamase class C family)